MLKFWEMGELSPWHFPLGEIYWIKLNKFDCCGFLVNLFIFIIRWIWGVKVWPCAYNYAMMNPESNAISMEHILEVVRDNTTVAISGWQR